MFGESHQPKKQKIVSVNLTPTRHKNFKRRSFLICFTNVMVEQEEEEEDPLTIYPPLSMEGEQKIQCQKHTEAIFGFLTNPNLLWPVKGCCHNNRPSFVG